MEPKEAHFFLFFCRAVIPVSLKLEKPKYMNIKLLKMNHTFYIDDLKLYEKIII